MATELWDRRRQRSVPLWLPILAAALIVARIVSLQMQPAAVAKADLVKWVPLTSIQGGAVRGANLILYDFTAEWCRPCHMLDDEVFRDPEIAKRINERFIAVRVVDRMQEDGSNAPAIAALQRRYDVSAFPTVVIVDPKGNVRHKMVGYPGKRTVADMIENVR